MREAKCVRYTYSPLNSGPNNSFLGSIIHSFIHSFLHFLVSHHDLKAVVYYDHYNLSCIIYYYYYYVLNYLKLP